jgi:sugar phosphate isomerase/epimerase
MDLARREQRWIQGDQMTTTSRRDFLIGSGAAVAAAYVSAGRAKAAPLTMPIGLQLYTVRDLLPKDFDGTQAKVRSAGYTVVEAAGYYHKTAAEFRHSMDQAGLKCVSTHHPMSELSPKLDELIEYGKALGLAYIVCPSPTHKDPSAKGPLSLEDWRWVAGELNRIGEKVKAAGMVFGYHNHGPEFGTENGVVFYDELLRLTDPKVVVFEMDCGWVFAAGRNPLDYLSKTPERFPLLHIKDVEREGNGKYRSHVLGTGKMDYAPILRAATGLKQYFVEQEEFDIDPIEAIRQDADYMRRLNV